jgi:NitT/TauT family transport system substrate-binding protein
LRKYYLKFKLSKTTAIAVVVIIVAGSLGLSSFLYLNSQKPFEEQMQSLSIGITLLESSSPAFVAEDQHLFEANGLNVTLKYYDVGLNAVNGMLSGEVDMAWPAEYILVGNAFQNQPIKVVAAAAKTDFAFLVARRDHGVNSVFDLYGKRIGVVRGTVMEFYLGRFLELRGVRISEVTLVNMTLGQSANLLISGGVDAMIAFPPYTETAQRVLGDNAVAWSAQSNQMLYGLIAGRTEWIQQHPESVTRLLKALSQTQDFIAQHPSEAKNIVQRKMNYTSEYIDTVWSRNDFSLSLDQSLILAMENEGRWMITNNLTTQTMVPDFVAYLYLDGLTSLKPESVNIIR